MTKLLELVLAEVKKLPEDKQNEIAAELIAYLLDAADDDRDLQLSDEQLAEVRRRRTDPHPKNLSLEELEARLRRLRA